MKRIFTLLIIIPIIFSVSSCKKDKSSYPQATITADGFDFSEGIINSDESQNDGKTTTYQPENGYSQEYPNNGDYMWWKNSQLDDVTYKNTTKHLGEMTLDDISTVPGDWDEVPNIIPLLNGHVYVAKCRDGYVKFRVLSKRFEENTAANIEYKFSETETF